MNHIKKLKLGCDPEFFFIDKAESPTYDVDFLPNTPFVLSPAVLEKDYGLVPLVADPKHPLYIDEPLSSGNRFRYVGDGAAIELNFAAPFGTLEEMYEGVQTAKRYLFEWSQARFGLGISDRPSINFDYKKWWTPELMQDPRFMMGIIFGCDADEDAFDASWVCEIVNATVHPARYGGGHEHFSGIPEIYDYIKPFVQLLGITCGNFCNAHTDFPELLARRAQYYGKPGKYRPQKYKTGETGVEYRTPSNEWTTWPLDKLNEMYFWVDRAIDLLLNKTDGKAALYEYSERTCLALAKADREESSKILSALA